ncbi:hypothetical protein [Marinirhabdus gelatinilytica]|uniref:O-antigen ligase-like membrane protein n=1 Tax=Marinirhabdus gelatinilytica TaxID=1703343 RepID=A0A370QKD8_9FLAO|nr:hypothetical protein [Marinirhabdus gelatinilytica]RDK88520.1 hypothetical protein C8D94_101394 [Marinirhabdus gelatinilytica]
MFLRNLLFILLILQPFIDKLARKAGWSINIFNELLSIGVFLAFMVVLIHRKKLNSLALLMFAFIGYCCLLVLYRGVYPLGFFQVVIYSQFFFYFFYFLTLSREEKNRTILSFKKIMAVFVYVIAIIAIFEAKDHTTFRNWMGVHSVKRGINYFYLISFFGSGPSLAIFITIFVALWHYCHYALKQTIKKKHIFNLVLAIILGVLSFSRKEVFFIFIFLVFFPYPSRNQLNKWLKRLIFFTTLFTGLIVYYLAFFTSANTVALDKDYVRYKIVDKSAEIYADHFPWGSGPGTWGSRVSLWTQHIYEQYNIGPDLLGWKPGSQGPIYDAFLFTLFTEIGIGIFILFLFTYKIFEAKTITKDSYGRFTKNFLILFLLVLGMFAPMFTNNFGFVIMALTALMISNVSLFKFKRWYA